MTHTLITDIGDHIGVRVEFEATVHRYPATDIDPVTYGCDRDDVELVSVMLEEECADCKDDPGWHTDVEGERDFCPSCCQYCGGGVSHTEVLPTLTDPWELKDKCAAHARAYVAEHGEEK